MSIDEKSLEGFVKQFHHYHELLAPDFGCGAASSSEFADLPKNEQKRLIAAARLAAMDAQTSETLATGSELNIFASYPQGTEGRDCGC